MYLMVLFYNFQVELLTFKVGFFELLWIMLDFLSMGSGTLFFFF